MLEETFPEYLQIDICSGHLISCSCIKILSSRKIRNRNMGVGKSSWWGKYIYVFALLNTISHIALKILSGGLLCQLHQFYIWSTLKTVNITAVCFADLVGHTSSLDTHAWNTVLFLCVSENTRSTLAKSTILCQYGYTCIILFAQFLANIWPHHTSIFSQGLNIGKYTWHSFNLWQNFPSLPQRRLVWETS